MKSKRRPGGPFGAWRAVTAPSLGAPSHAAPSRSPAPLDSGANTTQDEGATWWDLTRDHKPERGVELRAIVEIAMALHEALPQGPVRVTPMPRVDAALLKPNGKAVLHESSESAGGPPARLLAPEVQRGGVVDLSANLYCLGAMLFEAVTGKAFESGHQVREELNRIRTRGPRAKSARSRDSDLLMLAARTTSAEPAARGPEPRKFATHVVVIGGAQVASRQALAQWIGASLGNGDLPGAKSLEPAAKLTALPSPVVIHAPPVSITTSKPAEPAPEKIPEKPAPVAEAQAPSSEGEGEAPDSDDAGPTELLEEAPAEMAARLDGESEQAASDLEATVAPRRQRSRRGSSHALLAVLAMALLMAIATSARLVHRAPHLAGASDAIGQSDLPARTGDRERQNVAARDQGQDQALSGEAPKPCLRPSNDGSNLSTPERGADDANSDTVVLKPANAATRQQAQPKSDLKEPDYGI